MKSSNASLACCFTSPSGFSVTTGSSALGLASIAGASGFGTSLSFSA